MDADPTDAVPVGPGAPAIVDDTNATFGQILRAARERRGLTLEAIAASTNIPLRHLSALERDDLAAIPAGLYQRAEIRAFAEAVGLDPRIALAALERTRRTNPATPAAARAAVSEAKRPAADDPKRSVPSATVPRETAPVRDDSRPTAGFLLPVVAALVLLIAAGFGMRSMLPKAPAPSAPPQTLAQQTPQTPLADPPSAEPQPQEPPAERPDAAPAPETTRDTIATSGASISTATATTDRAPIIRPDPPAAPAAPADVPNLQIVTEPSGARVTVDGIGWGQTPVTIRYLPHGTKRVRVTLDGYDAQEQVVQLAPDSPTTVRFALRRTP
jgi:cytoskeletal protein RodZ